MVSICINKLLIYLDVAIHLTLNSFKMALRKKIIYFLIIMLSCLVLPAFFPYGNMIMLSIFVSSLAMILIVFYILVDKQPGFENEDDQITPP
jgi:hypothetical protein